MNRSILIIMCDFLVLSVLSLSFGVAPIDYRFHGHGTMVDNYTANAVLQGLRQDQQRLTAMRQALLDAQHEAGFADEREKQLAEINRQLAETRSRLHFLEAKLAGGEVGVLSKEDLQSQIEAESRRRHELQGELERLAQQLDASRERYQTTVKDMELIRQSQVEAELRRRHELQGELERLAQHLDDYRERYQTTVKDMELIRQRLKEAQEELTGKDERLVLTSEQLQKTSQELEGTRDELLATRSSAEKTAADLQGVSGKLSETEQRLGQLDVEIKSVRKDAHDTQLELYYSRGRLSATEKELAETKSRLDQLRKVSSTRDLEISETRKQLDNLKQMLRTAVTDLSQTKAELNDTKTEAAEKASSLVATQSELLKKKGEAEAARVALEETRIRLEQAEQDLRSDALEKYAGSALKLEFKINEERLLMDYTASETLYLPEIAIGDRRFLISNLEVITGMFREITGYSRVSQLNYVASTPQGEAPQRLKGPILALPSDPRVCLMEISPVREQALQVITATELKKRGLQDLHLFKYGSFGKEFCGLEGRCSMSFESGNQYLYIRNSTQRRDDQLKAAVGDFVMTRQGDFVGVVVAVENFDMGRRQEAKCFIFPDGMDFSDALRVPLSKTPDEKYYAGFAGKVEQLGAVIKALSREQRRR